MDKKSIKVKSYDVLAVNLLLMLILPVIIFFIVMFVVNQVSYTNPVYETDIAYYMEEKWRVNIIIIVIGTVIVLALIIGAIIMYFRKLSYDIYTVDGFERIRKNETIHKFSWDEVHKIVYFGLLCVIILAPSCLMIELKEPYKTPKSKLFEKEYDKHLVAKIPHKYYKQLKEIIPIEIKPMKF